MPAALDAALSAAIAAHCGVPADHVVTAVGSSGANFLALASLVRPGDAVLVEDPGYAPLAAAARLFGAEVIALPRPFARGYAVEPEAIAAAITPRTRLVVLTRPHNPTGAVIDGPTLEAIAGIAERARVHVLVDEVYLDTLGGASLSPAALVSERFISTSSLTKAYGLAGLRCGWALAAPASPHGCAPPGPSSRRRRRRRSAWPCGPSPISPCSPIAPGGSSRAIASACEQTFAGRDDVAWVLPAGGTVAFPRLLRVADVDGFVDRLLVEHHTAVVPGRFFGHPQHVRVAFGMGAEELARGLDAVAAALDAATHLETVRR